MVTSEMAEGRSGELRELASSLVSELRAEFHRSRDSQQAHSSTSTSSTVRQETSTSGKRTYRAPSLFANLKKSKKSKVEKALTRDFMLLPPDCKEGNGRVRIPRGGYRNQLIGAQLIGKVQLRPSMTDLEVRREICTVFATPMGISTKAFDELDSDDAGFFEFDYLQSSGSGTCSLCIPSVSKSFSWTGQEVARLSKQGKMIYLLARKPLNLPKSSHSPPSSPISVDDDNDDDSLPVVHLSSQHQAQPSGYIEILDDYPSPIPSNSSDDQDLQVVLEESMRDVNRVEEALR
jgi:hypothetical protein